MASVAGIIDAIKNWDSIKRFLFIRETQAVRSADMMPMAPAIQDQVPSLVLWPPLQWEIYLWDASKELGRAVRLDHGGPAVDVMMVRLIAPGSVPRPDAVQLLNELIPARVRDLRLNSFLDTCHWQADPDQATDGGTLETVDLTTLGNSDVDGTPTRDRIEVRLIPGFNTNGIASLLIEATERCEAHVPASTYYTALNFDLNAPCKDPDPPSLAALMRQGLEKCASHNISAQHCVWYMSDDGLKVVQAFLSLPSIDSKTPSMIIPPTPYVQFRGLLGVDLERRLLSSSSSTQAVLH